MGCAHGSWEPEAADGSVWLVPPAGWDCSLPRSPALPERLACYKSLPPTWLVGSKPAGELIVMNKRRIRGFSRCQASSFIPLRGSLWLTLPRSRTSPAGAGAALSLCEFAADLEGAGDGASKMQGELVVHPGLR